MTQEDLALFKQAVDLAQAGRKLEAYAQFSTLIKTNPHKVDLLLWLIFTTPEPTEAQHALERAIWIDPANPAVAYAQHWLSQQPPPQTKLKNKDTASTKSATTPPRIAPAPNRVGRAGIGLCALLVTAFLAIIILVLIGPWWVDSNGKFEAVTRPLPTPIHTATGVNTTASASANNPQLATLLAQLDQAETEQNWDKVISVGESILQLYPNYSSAAAKTSSAYTERGIKYYLANQFDKSLADHNRAIVLNPNNAKAYNGRGNAYKGLKNYQKALEDYTHTIQIDPQYVNAYYNLGLLYADLKDDQKALENYDKALQLDPTHILAHINRGALYVELEYYPRAIADYTEAIKLNPKIAAAYLGRGYAYASVRQYDEALADYNKAIELAPTYGPAYYNRGWAYKLKGDTEAARRDFQKALDLGDEEAKKELAEL